jgi:hypothetical protein
MEEREGVGLACLFFPLPVEERRCMRTGREGSEGKRVGGNSILVLDLDPKLIYVLVGMTVKNHIDQDDKAKILFITKSPFAQTSVRGFQI